MRERLAVADHHADDLARRHPRAHPRLARHLGEADLVAGPVAGVLRTPAAAGASRASPSPSRPARCLPRRSPRRDQVLTNSLTSLGCDGDLGVALGDVDDLARRGLGEVGCSGRRRAAASTAGAGSARPSGQRPGADLLEGLLGEVGDEAGVGAVLHHRRRARGCRPTGRSSAAAPCGARTACAACGCVVAAPSYGIPQLDGGVEIADAVIAAPRQDRARVDVPREVEDDIARADVARQLSSRLSSVISLWS